MNNLTFSSDDQLILVGILHDYRNFPERRYKNDQQIDEIAEKLKNLGSDKNVILKSKLANEFGVTRKTLMNRIFANSELIDELKYLGWNQNSKSFYPKEVELIKKYLS